MTDLRQDAQQALAAWDSPMGMKELCVVMDALRTALEQQAEPVSELQKRYLESEKAFQQQAEPVMLNGLTESETNATASVMGLTKQAEPVAWMDREGDLYKMPEIPEWAPPHTMLYTTPPQRQWVGLTEEDWAKVADMPDTFDQGVAWAQARLKERNNG